MPATVKRLLEVAVLAARPAAEGIKGTTHRCEVPVYDDVIWILGGLPFVQNPIYFGVYAVVSDHLSKGVLPLANPFTAYTKSICDTLPTFSASQRL